MKTLWSEDSILNRQNTASPAEIFAAYCNVIGDYYTARGFKYSASRPKIRYETKDLFIDINFWSSRSNIPGEYVAMEILPQVGSKQLKKWIKLTGIGRNEYILAPKDYDFRNLNIYENTSTQVASLLMKIDAFIFAKLKIENNKEFIDQLYRSGSSEIIEDNFACYLKMTMDPRLEEYIGMNKANIGQQLFETLTQYR